MSEKSLEDIRKLFLIFKKAIEAERAAQDTYLQARELSDDNALKEIFNGMYQDEVGHEQILIERYNKLRQESALEDRSIEHDRE
ncbi:MAG: hypothetical protein KAR40_18210 [Candidatus Sabulitectum sp.]|nr:hypothetical protein [Candidatus Sabulitectum sp.]